MIPQDLNYPSQTNKEAEDDSQDSLTTHEAKEDNKNLIETIPKVEEIGTTAESNSITSLANLNYQ